ncbi:MAG: DUF1385 domain-containing protein [Fimbriimonadaceae bacterium]
MPQGEYLQYGGQAIIEGVMMRSMRHFAVAVRAPNGKIVLECEPLEKTWIGRQKWLKLPFLRGMWGLLDALTLGYRAMRFAANVQLDPKYLPPDAAKKEAGKKGAESPSPPTRNGVAAEKVDQSETIAGEGSATNGHSDALVGEADASDGNLDGLVTEGLAGSKVVDSGQKLRDFAVFGAIVFAVVFGLFLFNYLPNLLAIQLKSFGVDNPTQINFATEVIKIVFVLGYVYLISLMPDIKRVFQYHGAEHKAINVLEARETLSMENCRRQTRLHPRCGTSFAIVVLIVSLIVFTLLPKPEVADSRFLTSIVRFLFEIPFLPIIAGLSYELIRFAGKMRNSALVKVLFAPGLATQFLTTREPDDDQIEVALVSLQAVVEADRKAGDVVEIGLPGEVQATPA